MKSSIDRYRDVFGNFNEVNCERAAKEMPELLLAVAQDLSLKELSRAIAMSHLYFTLDATHIAYLSHEAKTNPSPLIREGAIQGLHGMALGLPESKETVAMHLDTIAKIEQSESVLKTLGAAMRDVTYLISHGE